MEIHIKYAKNAEIPRHIFCKSSNIKALIDVYKGRIGGKERSKAKLIYPLISLHSSKGYF